LNPQQKERRRRMLAAIHASAAKQFADTGDVAGTLAELVGNVSGGRTRTCADCYFDELSAVLDTLNGKPVRQPQFRERVANHQTISQDEFLSRLIEQVDAERGGEFGSVVVRAKVGTDDPTLMTTREKRQAIAILQSYAGKIHRRDAENAEKKAEKSGKGVG